MAGRIIDIQEDPKTGKYEKMGNIQEPSSSDSSGAESVADKVKNSKMRAPKTVDMGQNPDTGKYDQIKSVQDSNPVSDTVGKIVDQTLEKGLAAMTGGASEALKRVGIDTKKILKFAKNNPWVFFISASMPLLVMILLVSLVIGSIIGVANETVCNDNFFLQRALDAEEFVRGKDALAQWRRLCPGDPCGAYISGSYCSEREIEYVGQGFAGGTIRIQDVQFTPGNEGMYYILAAMRYPEYNDKGQDFYLGHKDSCGPYQQRLNELTDTRSGAIVDKAKEILGEEKYNELFAGQSGQDLRATQDQTTSESQENVCKSINAEFGLGFWDELQIARFESANLKEDIDNFKPGTDDATDLLCRVQASHRPEGTVANGSIRPCSELQTTEWYQKASIALNLHTENNQYSQRRSSCGEESNSALAQCTFAGGSIGALRPGEFMIPSEGTVTRCAAGHGYDACDIAKRPPPPIYASKAGEVIFTREGTCTNLGCGYGNYVIVDHKDGYQTWYAHLTTINVRVGQQVNQGDQLGIMGCTGNSVGVFYAPLGCSGVHLHFEIRQNGVRQHGLTEKGLFGCVGCKNNKYISPQD